MTKEISSEKPKRKRAPFPFMEVGLLALTIASLAFGGYFFYKYQNVNDKYKEVTMTTEDKIKRVVNEVAALYSIPKYEDEQPSVPGIEGTAIYTILEQDLENIKKTNSFFSDAKANDILVAYKKANTAILYRPSEKKIIKTGAYAEAALVKVEVSIIADQEIAKNIENNLKAKFPNVNVTTKSPNVPITGTGLVVDVTGKEAVAAKQLAEALGYQVGQLPTGETAPDGVSLVIIAPNSQ